MINNAHLIIIKKKSFSLFILKKSTTHNGSIPYLLKYVTQYSYIIYPVDFIVIAVYFSPSYEGITELVNIHIFWTQSNKSFYKVVINVDKSYGLQFLFYIDCFG